MAQRYNYFTAFEEMADFGCQAAAYLDETFADFDPKTLPDRITEMHQIEHAADDKRHEIISHLAKEFLPPIERTDIIRLTSRLDDIVDCIDDVMHHLYTYNIQSLLPASRDFTRLIIRCCESVKAITKEFQNFRKSDIIFDLIVNTNHLESEGDMLYSEIMRNIFTSELSNKDIFIWSYIISSLEDCCDFCEESSELFESAILENS